MNGVDVIYGEILEMSGTLVWLFSFVGGIVDIFMVINVFNFAIVIVFT
jgi:hypothetical protein